MNDRTHLEVVREEPGEAAAPAMPEPAAPRRSTPRWVWALAVFALVCALGWGVAAREASRLGAALVGTQAELAGTQQRLQAFDTRLEEIRQRSRALTVQMDALAAESRSLEELAGRDPETEQAPEQP